MFAMSVAKLSAVVPLSCSTAEYIQGRSLISALNVGRPSSRVPSSPYTSVSTLEKSPMNVISVGKPSAGGQPLLSINGFTWGRTHTNLNVAQILFMTLAIWPLERDMGRPSATVQTLSCSGQFTVMKNPWDVMNVGKF